MVVHHDTLLAPTRPNRDTNSLQHVRASQNGQTRTLLLSTPPLMPHARTTNLDPHVPKPEPGLGLHPPLHLLPPHTRATRGRTHSCVPPRETHHLQRGSGIPDPDAAAQDPGSPPQHRPHHIRLRAHETRTASHNHHQRTSSSSPTPQASLPSHPSQEEAPCN